MFYPEMTVAQFCAFYIEETEQVCIWSAEEEKDVFMGTYREAQQSQYADETVSSFGIEGGIICINIR